MIANGLLKIPLLVWIVHIELKTKSMKEFDYDEYRNTELTKGNFNIAELTEEQKDLILLPSEAPENYACDGEITPQEAFDTWIYRLKRSGLNHKLINQAIQFHFK